MSLFIYIDGVERAASIRLESGFQTASAAELGTVSVAQIQVDDPDGTINIVGWKAAWIVETAATPPRLWTGFIGARTIERGPYRTGAGRVWTCEAVDINWNLTRRVIRSASGKRPAETDLARLTWLLGHASMSGLVYSGTITNLTANPINIGEADYRGQYPMDVLADITPVSGKTAWVRWNDATARNELFYDQATAAVDSSTLRISNVLSDVDNVVTFAPYIDASMERTPEDTYSGVLMQYQKGFLYSQNATTLAAFAERDLFYSTTRIGLAASAQTTSTLMLASRSVERETVTVNVRVPTANVNDIREGQRISVKFSHLPGLTAFAWTRVVRKNVVQLPDQSYVVTLNLSTSIRPSLNAGSPADFPYVPGYGSCTTTSNVFAGVLPVATGPVTQYWNGTPDNPVNLTDGNLATGCAFPNGVVGAGTYYAYLTMDLGAVVTIESAALTAGDWSQQCLSLEGSADNAAWTEIVSGPTFAAAAIGQTATVAISATSYRYWRLVHKVIMTGLGTPHGVTAFELSVAGCTASLPPPPPGQWVEETITMTGASGTTTNPFADGSLTVKVDLLDQTAAITAQDGTAGTFTLGFTPKTGEVVTVRYQGR